MTPTQLYAHGLKLIENGDAYEGFALLWESYRQEKNAKLAEDLAHCFFHGLGCKMDELFGAKLLVENKLNAEIGKRMGTFGSAFGYGSNLKEVYVYGKYINFTNLSTIEWLARHVYTSSYGHAQRATLLFICWTQKENILPRDLRRLIGEMIWESRVDPELWKVKV